MSNILGNFTGSDRQTNDTVDSISKIAQGALCVSSFPIQEILNPSALLDNAQQYLLGEINSQINSLFGLVNSQLSNVLRTVQPSSGNSTADFIFNLLDSLNGRSDQVINNNNNLQNCASISAALSRCVQSQVNKAVTPRVQASINSGTSTDSVASDITQSLGSSNVFSQFADKQTSEVNKAYIQLTRINKKQPF